MSVSSENEIASNEFLTLWPKLSGAPQTAGELRLKLRPPIMPTPLQRSCLEVRPTPTASREQSTKSIRPPTSLLRQQQRGSPASSERGGAAPAAGSEKPSGARRASSASQQPSRRLQHNHASLFPQSMVQNATRALFHAAPPAAPLRW